MKAGSFRALVAACFFMSGAAGLLYEVTWTRALGLVFGHTVHAITTVLAVFMGGLALGSFLLGRWADRLRRPLRAYALMEAGIGVYCIATPLLLAATEPAYLFVHRIFGPSVLGAAAIQAVFAAVVLVPATTLMGATLPVLARAVVPTAGAIGSTVGSLYAVNTLGAVVGAAGTGFVLLPTLGLRTTIALGVALNLAAGGLALALARRSAAAEGLSSAEPEPPPGASTGSADRAMPAAAALFIAIAVSGAASMAYEIAWTRALGLVLGSSTYAFSAMLTTFLVGLAVGAFAVSRALRRRPLGFTGFAALEVAAGVTALLFLPLLGRLPELVVFLYARLGLSHGASVAVQFAVSFAAMIVPTLVIGATFPWALALGARGLAHVGRDVGGVYSANTLGTIAGSVGAGFLLVPRLGIQGTVIAAAGANVAAGVAVWALAPGRRRAARIGWATASAVSFAALAMAIPRWDRGMMSSGAAVYVDRLLQEADPVAQLRKLARGREPAFYAEGLSTTVTVDRVGPVLALSVNGKVDASNGTDMPTQLLVGHLPALLRPDARRALMIGLASGVTAGALAQHPLDVIDVAEIEPAMREASAFFDKENRGVLRDPRVRLLFDDGRHVLEAATEPYDLIVSQPSNPWIAGVASLFTVDFYRRARAHLSERGLVAQWFQAYNVFPRDIQMMVRSFREVFPDATLWRAARGDYILIGGNRPLEIDLPAVARRMRTSPGVREDLARIHWTTADGLLATLALDAAGLARLAEGAPINSDDLPLLEFSAPLALHQANLDENEAFVRAWAGTGVRVPDGDAGRLEVARVLWSLAHVEDALAEIERLGRNAALDPDVAVGCARLLLAMGLPQVAAHLMNRLTDEFQGVDAVARLKRALGALQGHRLDERFGAIAEGWRTQVVSGRHEDLGRLLDDLGRASGEKALSLLAAEERREALRTAHPLECPKQVGLPGLPVSSLGSRPGAWDVADLNGDGKLDVVFVESGGDKANVLLGNGDGTFRPLVSYGVGSDTRDVAIADVNGDGRPDVLTANHATDDVSILLGNGDGTFARATRKGTGPGSRPTTVDVADVDGNGYAEVVVGLSEGICVLSNSAETLGAMACYPIAGPARSVVVADLSGSGKPDIAYLATKLGVMRNDGSGKFSSRVEHAIPGGVGDAVSLATADFDGDGRPDLVVSTVGRAASRDETQIAVYANDGAGRFAAPRIRRMPGKAGALAVGDFDGDGKPELAVALNDLGAVSVLRSDGSGLLPVADYPALPSLHAIAAGDFTGDGKIDLLAMSDTGLARVLHNTGEGVFPGRFTAPSAEGVDSKPLALVMGDFNGDGNADAVVLSARGAGSGSVTLFLGRGDGTFAPGTSHAIGSPPRAAATADVNGDGYDDVVIVAEREVIVFLGSSEGRLSSAVALGMGGVAVALADLNGDRWPDLVLASGAGAQVSVFINDGSGKFRVPSASYSTGAGSPRLVTIADFTHDGLQDIATANDDATITVFRNTGKGSFTRDWKIQVDRPPRAMVAADLDRDGWPDLALAGHRSDGTGIGVLLNRRSGGSIAFTPEEVYATPGPPAGLAAGDLNANGHLDLAVTTSDGFVGLLLNAGKGAFRPMVRYRVTDRNAVHIALADLNRDFRPDLVVLDDGELSSMTQERLVTALGSCAP